MPTVKKSHYIASLLFVVPLIAILSACGAADPDNGQTPDPQESKTQTYDSAEEYQLAFAECMRGKGIDMEDPNNGGQSITQADEAFMEAAEACQSELGQPPAGEGDNGNMSADALREEYVKIAECLREHGVDVPDPAPGEDLEIPSDVPADAFETCAPNGVTGPATGGN